MLNYSNIVYNYRGLINEINEKYEDDNPESK